MSTSTKGIDTEPAKEQMRLQTEVSLSRKKRIVSGRDFDLILNKSVLLGLEAARSKRQQLFILKAMQEHLQSIKAITSDGDHRVDKMITDYLKPRSEMKEYILSDIKHYSLLKRPGPSTLDVAVDPIAFDFAYNLVHYRKII